MSTASNPGPVVITTAGPVRGFWRGRPGTADASAAFLGIPFAAAPVGDLRFAAPRDPDPWTAVRHATAYGPTPQRGDKGQTLIPEPSIPGAATLNVNVFTPALPSEAEPASSTAEPVPPVAEPVPPIAEPVPPVAALASSAAGPTRPAAEPARPAAEPLDALPVLVWIHGGGYVDGSPACEWYDGRAFNRDGVVTVSLSYRLGFDGFGIIDGAPANRGVLDWIAGLEWVRRNIAAFGGDPSRVTIAGQSAGAGAVLTLLGLERAQHLFHAAMAFSPALADIAPELAQRRTEQLAVLTGCAPTVAGFRAIPERTVMRNQPVAALLGATRLRAILAPLTNGLPWGPVIDGDVLPRPALDAIRSGIGSDKPLLLGATDDEFTMSLDRARAALRFVPTSLALWLLCRDRTVRRAYLRANRGLREPRRARDGALRDDRPPRRRGTAARLGRFVTDRVFRALIVRTAEARGAAPTWAYRFAWVSPVKGWSCHCLDVPFWFDVLDDPYVPSLTGSAPPQHLATEMHAAAARFVRGEDPSWPAWHADPGVARVFGGSATEPPLSRTAYDGTLPLV